MKKIIFNMFMLAVLVMIPGSAFAQESEENAEKKGVEVMPYWSSNWGATTSFGTPAETRKIKSSALMYNYVVGCDVTKMITPKLGITSGLRYERKANQSNVVMKNFLTTVTLAGEGTPTHGYFSGNSKSRNDNSYLTIPVMAVYRASSEWDFRGGFYFSYAVRRNYTGEATDGKIRENPLVPATAVSYSTSDFSDGVSKFDWGLQIGTVHNMWKKLYVAMDINWGLKNVLDAPESGMTMNVYNLYYSCGLGWRF